jgi:predicted outer membrane repeat protein
VNDCNFVANVASGDGGGILCDRDSLITVAVSDFNDNAATNGAGIYFEPNCISTVAGSVFVNNDAAEDGGAIYFAEANDISIVDCNVAFNTAVRGGALFCQESPNSRIINCSIQHNESARMGGSGIGQGGGIYSFAGLGLIANTEISHNTTGTSGGGIYLAAGEENLTTIKNCLLSYNTAVRDGGGVSSNWQNRLAVSNCTITDNTGGAFGGGLYVSYESNVEVNDSIIWHSVSNKGAQIAVCSGDPAYPLPSMVKVTYTDVGPYFDPRTMRRAGYVPVGGSHVLTVTPTGDPATLVNAILGRGIEVSNISYTGLSNAAGIFTGGAAAGLGMESGVILTNGDARLAPGANPNQPGVNASDFAGVPNMLAGDLDLTALVPGYLTYDATVLEFDFTSRGGDLFLTLF